MEVVGKQGPIPCTLKLTPCTHLGVHQLNSLVDDSHEREKLYILSIPWVEEWEDETPTESLQSANLSPRANSFVAI